MSVLPEIGQVALLLALMVAVLQAVLPLLGAHRGIAPLMAVARPAAGLQLALVLLAFSILTYAFVVGDFSVRYVAENSNSLLPTYYRFTAVWGAHEGSLLMWALILAMWTAAVAMFSRALPQNMSCDAAFMTEMSKVRPTALKKRLAFPRRNRHNQPQQIHRTAGPPPSASLQTLSPHRDNSMHRREKQNR